MQKVSDLPPGTLKSRLVVEGVTQYCRADTTVVFAGSMHKNNCNFYSSAMLEYMHVLMTGEAPPGTKNEFFYNRVRLKNSCRDKPLPPMDTYDDPSEAIVDWDDATMTATPIIKGDYDRSGFKDLVSRIKELVSGKCTEPPAAAAAAAGIKAKLIEFRDGSKTQFQGGDSFVYYQLFDWLTGIDYENVCCQAENGKGPADGAGVIISSTIKSAAKRGHNAELGSRGLILLCASKRAHTKTPRIAKLGLTAHTDYLYIACPDDGSGFHNLLAERGYDGSSKHHQFRAAEGVRTGPADAAWLEARNRPCSCGPCMRGDWDNCLFKKAVGLFPNPTARCQLEPATGKSARATTRTKATKKFVEGLAAGSVVVLRVHGDETNDDSERYFLGIVTKGTHGEPEKFKAPATKEYSSVMLSKGLWAVRFTWLSYRPQKRRADGARGYQITPGLPLSIFPTKCIVSNLEVHAAAQGLEQNADSETMWLPKAAHEAIVAHPMELHS